MNKLFLTTIYYFATIITTIKAADSINYWDITYVELEGEPNTRRAIGVNGVWPPPSLEVDLGSKLIVHMRNSLDVPTTLHSHGLFQNGTNFMDGPSHVTQCPIPPGMNFTYEIPVAQHGTYFIHAHHLGHYVDGLRSPLIIKPETEVYTYDEDITISLSDWYNLEHKELMKTFFSIYNPNGLEPVPDYGLINHKTQESFKFEAGKVYRLRFINMSAFAMFKVELENHKMEVVEVDGVDVERHEIDYFAISAAQRYSVLVQAKNTTEFNYKLRVDVDVSMFGIPSDIKTDLTADIIYDENSVFIDDDSIVLGENGLDDMELNPVEKLEPLPTSEDGNKFQRVDLAADFAVFQDGKNHGAFDEDTFVLPEKTPTLLSAMTLGSEYNDKPELYGTARAIVLDHMQVVEVVIANLDTGSHPFHMHGHSFQVVAKGPLPAPDTIEPSSDNPVRRDTVQIEAEEYAAIRFVADNPGAWLMHCHIEWHLESGLAVTFIEAPNNITSTPPQYVLDQCEIGGYPIRGNANGKEGDDMEGYTLAPQAIEYGIFLKGLIALALCVASSFVGMWGVIWYAKEEPEPSSSEDDSPVESS